MKPEQFLPYLVGMTIMVAALFIMNLFTNRGVKSEVHDRLQRFKQPGTQAAKQETAQNILLISDYGSLSKLRLRLFWAGWTSPIAPAVYWLLRFAFATAGAVMLFYIGVHNQDVLSLDEIRLGQVLFAVGGFMLPSSLLNLRIEGRKKAILWELPEILDLMVVCVEAGMGLEQAISRVTQEISTSCPNMYKELRRMSLEILAGKGRAEALRRMATRVGVDELEGLTSLIIQADTFGTSIAQTLRVFSDTLRTKRFQQAEELAGKLPVKLLLPVVLFIFPMLLVIILGPASIRISEMF
ncbi:type II secretion system F family protein [Desulfovibrio mangrovi]|uniref:type II secretion system F family protein n=1 Tax=Desulfovibrio mangrovi TaxID=2976983 RepID=UPI0022453880|nr:type II secretion system F family protein [Desulfovibrio mangrovi]UZP68798.1 type II secretion system F family protein [Desulfovibrio mangrovi]